MLNYYLKDDMSELINALLYIEEIAYQKKNIMPRDNYYINVIDGALECTLRYYNLTNDFENLLLLVNIALKKVCKDTLKNNSYANDAAAVFYFRKTILKLARDKRYLFKANKKLYDRARK